MGEFGSEFGGELRKIKKRESEMSFEGSHLLEGLKEPFSDLRQKEKLCLGKETKITTEFDFDGLFDNKDLLEIPKDSELNTDTSPIEDDGPSSDAFSIKTELKESNTIQDVPSDDLKQQINDEITDEIVRLRKLKDSWELAEKEATSDYNTEIQYKNSEISREVKPRMNLMEVWVIAEAEAALGEKLGHEKTQIGSDLMLTKEFAPELPEERKMDDLWRLSEKYLARGYEIVREKLLVNENKNELPQEHERVEHILTTRKHEQNQKEIEHKELDIITEVKAKNLYQAECNVMVRERLNSAIVGSKNSRKVAMKSYALPHTPLQAVEKSFRSHEQELSVDQMTSGLLTDQSKVQPYNTNPIYRNSNEIPDYRDIKGITENIEIAQKIKQISKKANDSRFKLYILYHEDNPDLLYVGRTENVILKKRFEEHYSFAFRDSSNRKISKNIKERSKNGWHIEHLAVYILKNEPEIYLECEGRGLLFPKTYLNMVDLETFWINYFNSYTKGMNSKEGEGILIPLNTDLIYKKQFEILKSESMLIQKILHK